MSDAATRKAIEAVYRIESARLLGGLVRVVRDVGLAEDFAQEALLAAFERWPETGIPDNPGAWLMTTAKNRALDQLRRRKMVERKHEDLRVTSDGLGSIPRSSRRHSKATSATTYFALVLVACHPVLSTDARTALTLRLLGGLTTDEIARASGTRAPTIAQRIVRAKRTLSEARVPFEVPQGADLSARVPSVLEVIYLIFNEGYSATRGEDWMRTGLCDDALRLGRMLAAVVPDEAEVHGLVALMRVPCLRTRARSDAKGEPILLLDQNRGLLGPPAHPPRPGGLVARGVASPSAGPPTRCKRRSRPGLRMQERRPTPTGSASWRSTTRSSRSTGSPVVELNRAVAVSMAFGPAEGLELLDEAHQSPPCASTICCPARAATSRPSSADIAKPAPSSKPPLS